MRKMHGVTLYSAAELATELGVCASTIYYWLKLQRVPEPYQIGGRQMWDASDLKSLKRDIASGKLRHKANGVIYVGKSAVAKMCHKHNNHFQKLIDNGVIPEPSHNIGGKVPKYTEAEARAIVALVAAYTPPTPKPRTGRSGANHRVKDAVKSGLYNKAHAAIYLDMPIITFRNQLSRGVLPKPTHDVKGILCYTKKELDHFKVTLLADYFASRDA